MDTSELSRMVKTRPLPSDPVVVVADEGERAALAARFGLAAVESLRAEVALVADGSAILATGTLLAKLVQPCAVTGDDIAVSVEEPITLRFVRESTLRQTETEDGEIEVDLSDDEWDEIEFSGDSFDLGEAIAQSLGLAIDPYIEGPGADEARKRAGISGDDAPRGPLADALAALKKS